MNIGSQLFAKVLHWIFLPTHEYFVGVFNSVDPDYKPLGSGGRRKELQ